MTERPNPGTSREVTVQPAVPAEAAAWNALVRTASNGHIMALWEFFHYHESRFQNVPLVFRRGGRWLGVLPANRTTEDTLWSHQGVSFGGLIIARRTRLADVIEMWAQLRLFMQREGLRRLCYRPAPHPYHLAPREDDLYSLTQAGATIVDTKLHAMVRCHMKTPPRREWDRHVRRAATAGITVGVGRDIRAFWPHALAVLQKHGREPVHALEDILLLQGRLPDDLLLLNAASPAGDFLAGVLVLVSPAAITVLYLGETEEGRHFGAGRLLYNHFITAPEFSGRWLDMGQWADTETRAELDSLLSFKESAGARLIQRHTWEWAPAL
jgi:hypothetical protein